MSYKRNPLNGCSMRTNNELILHLYHLLHAQLIITCSKYSPDSENRKVLKKKMLTEYAKYCSIIKKYHISGKYIHMTSTISGYSTWDVKKFF